jgi:hypothetical protein
MHNLAKYTMKIHACIFPTDMRLLFNNINYTGVADKYYSQRAFSRMFPLVSMPCEFLTSHRYDAASAIWAWAISSQGSLTSPRVSLPSADGKVKGWLSLNHVMLSGDGNASYEHGSVTLLPKMMSYVFWPPVTRGESNRSKKIKEKYKIQHFSANHSMF